MGGKKKGDVLMATSEEFARYIGDQLAAAGAVEILSLIHI